MMSETVMPKAITENRNATQGAFPKAVIYPKEPLGQFTGMLTTAELLRLLDERQIRNADIARAIGVSPSRVTELRKGERAVKLDEAAKLVAAFDLESQPIPRVAPVHPAVARLIVLYIAAELGFDAQSNPALVRELTEDVRAFSEFVVEPTVRGNPEAVEAFFQAMRLRRPRLEDTGRQESDPERTR